MLLTDRQTNNHKHNLPAAWHVTIWVKISSQQKFCWKKSMWMYKQFNMCKKPNPLLEIIWSINIDNAVTSAINLNIHNQKTLLITIIMWNKPIV